MRKWSTREVVGFVTIVGLGAAAMVLLRPPTAGPATREPVRVPPDQEPHRSGGWFDLSPDGSTLVYRRAGADGASELWARDLDEPVARRVPGTEGAGAPAISPDGLEVAFVVRSDAGAPPGADRASGSGSLRVAALSGEGGRVLAAGASDGDVDWSRDGTWLYYTNARAGLSRVPTDGGPPEVLTDPEASGLGERHWGVEALPGNEAVLFTSSLPGLGDPRIEVLVLGTGEVRDLWSGSFGRYSPTGHLLFMDLVGTLLMAVPFDPERLAFVGTPVPLVTGVSSVRGRPLFAVSDGGDLVYGAPTGTVAVTPVWVDRDGAIEEIAGMRTRPGLAIWSSLALSPDDDRLAISSPDEDGAWHVRIEPLRVDAGPPIRLTGEGRLNYRPAWAADGRSLTFVSDRAGQADLWAADASGAGEAVRILDRPEVIRNGSRSADGRWLVFREGEAPSADIFARAEAGAESEAPADRSASTSASQAPADVIPLVVTPAGERSPVLSPNGRWLAYTWNAGGPWEVWVAGLPGEDDRGPWRVSPDGGEEPVWSPDGSELFYRSRSNELVAVPVREAPGLVLGEPRVLFSMRPFLGSDGQAQYDVTADGRRFVMLRLEEDGGVALVRIRSFPGLLGGGG